MKTYKYYIVDFANEKYPKGTSATIADLAVGKPVSSPSEGLYVEDSAEIFKEMLELGDLVAIMKKRGSQAPVFVMGMYNKKLAAQIVANNNAIQKLPSKDFTEGVTAILYPN